jgi:hypothetical protein
MRFAIDAPDPRATNPDPVLLKEHEIHRCPSNEMPPPGTIIWTCGWWVSAEPQLCSTAVRPIRAPRCFGSAAIVISVSAAASNRVGEMPGVIDGIWPRKSGSHQTPRWREPDSNHQSRSCERLFWALPIGDGGTKGGATYRFRSEPAMLAWSGCPQPFPSRRDRVSPASAFERSGAGPRPEVPSAANDAGGEAPPGRSVGTTSLAISYSEVTC